MADQDDKPEGHQRYGIISFSKCPVTLLFMETGLPTNDTASYESEFNFSSLKGVI